jgi:hypothetical protein
MCCELIELNRQHKYSNRLNVLANKDIIIRENNATSYEVYTIYMSSGWREDKPFNHKWSNSLEKSWKEVDNILNDIPSYMKSDSILEPFSTRKLKAIKLIQKMWRISRYNPDYFLCRKWCKQIQSTYYRPISL